MTGFTSVSERRSPLLLGATALAVLSLVFALFTVMAARPAPVLAVDDKSDCVFYVGSGDTEVPCADLVKASGNGGQTEILGQLFISYDCTTSELCFTIRATAGHTIEVADVGTTDCGDDIFIVLGDDKLHCSDFDSVSFVTNTDGDVIAVELCFADVADESTFTVNDAHANFDPQENGDSDTGGLVPGNEFTFTLNCPDVGSLIVLKTDDQDPATPLDAAFTVDGVTQSTGIDGITCFDDLVAGDPYDVTETTPPDDYDPAVPATQTGILAGTGTCEERTGDAPDAIFTNALSPLGSITVVKEIACDECETRTRGYYFNTADQHEEQTNALFAQSDEFGAGGILVDGTLFINVGEVQAYLDADISGDSDGENGLSARGQLTVQYITAVLNVRLNGEECDLLSRVYTNADSPFDGSWTVGDILAEAQLAFDDESDYSDQDIQEALNDINNSSESEENLLSCDANGTSTNGFTFELTDSDGNPVEGETVEDGTFTFSDLSLGTYTLVETGGPAGTDCTVVSASGGEGDDVVFDPETGTITITLTEDDAAVTVTVVNECDGGGGGGGGGGAGGGGGGAGGGGGGGGDVDAGTGDNDEDVSDTALDGSTSSIPAVIWALVLLACLGGLGSWSRAEARRRR